MLEYKGDLYNLGRIRGLLDYHTQKIKWDEKIKMSIFKKLGCNCSTMLY